MTRTSRTAPPPRYESAFSAIERARGEWVHLLNDDDLVLPGFYAKLRAGLEGQPAGVGMVVTRVRGCRGGPARLSVAGAALVFALGLLTSVEAIPQPASRKAEVIDLMALLKRSIEQKGGPVSASNSRKVSHANGKKASRTGGRAAAAEKRPAAQRRKRA